MLSGVWQPCLRVPTVRCCLLRYGRGLAFTKGLAWGLSSHVNCAPAMPSKYGLRLIKAWPMASCLRVLTNSVSWVIFWSSFKDKIRLPVRISCPYNFLITCSLTKIQEENLAPIKKHNKWSPTYNHGQDLLKFSNKPPKIPKTHNKPITSPKNKPIPNKRSNGQRPLLLLWSQIAT